MALHHPIRVAYDISVLGAFHFRSDQKTGVYRFTEELLFELLNIPNDIIITTLALHDFYPAYGTISSFVYHQKNKDHLSCKFQKTYLSKYKLSKLYLRYYEYYIHSVSKIKTANSLAYRMLQISKKIVDYTQNIDARLIVDTNSFDVYHSTYFKLPKRNITKELPRVLTVHDLIPIHVPHLVHPGLTKYFLQTLQSVDISQDWVSCDSEYTKNQFCDYTSMDPQRVFVIPLAAASNFYYIDNCQSIKEICSLYRIPNMPYFLSIASGLAPHKNLAHLLRCYIKFCLEYPASEINLVLIGSNWSGAQKLLTDIPDYHQFFDRIIFTGYVPDHHLSFIYNGALSFIFPSLYEGFGLPILEAMQCGTPVISSNATSLPEVVGDAGLLVDPLDSDALCQAMLNISTKPDLCNELSQHGLERSKLFSWKKCAQDTRNLYKIAVNYGN